MKRFANIFPTVAGLVLLAMATVQIVGNQGAITLQPADPILGLPSRYLFWGLAIAELAVAAICLFAESARFKHASVFWFTSHLVLYRVGLFCAGVHSAAAYFGTMAVIFGLSPGLMGFLFSVAVLCLWCGCGFMLLRTFRSHRQAGARDRRDSLPEGQGATLFGDAGSHFRHSFESAYVVYGIVGAFFNGWRTPGTITNQWY